MNKDNSNPVLELIAVCLLVFVLFFDFIMAIILKTLMYFAFVIGCILALAAGIGLCHRLIRGIGNLFKRKTYQETMLFLSHSSPEDYHE